MLTSRIERLPDLGNKQPDGRCRKGPGTVPQPYAIGRPLKRILTLFAILAAASMAGAAEKPVEVTVVMADYHFEPNHLTFQHDVHYQLHLENHGKETHEFTAPVFFATAEIDNPGILNRERSEILLQPGDTKDLFLTPHTPGTYDLRCADHDWYGMVGGITVK
jgi:uncharacterized cupredoxin-like copper-binding protein